MGSNNLLFFENIRQAVESIRSNLLRATLTILIIAFGVMAIVGVVTSIEAIKYWMGNTFSTLGANVFKIENRVSTVRIGGKKSPIRYIPITFHQANHFKEKMEGIALVNISARGNEAAKARYQNFETNNNVRVYGTDENFLTVESYQLDEGRSITNEDVLHRRSVCVIGSDISEKLFPNSSALNKHISVDKHHYVIIGVLKEKGTSFGSPGDKVCMIPITRLLSDYSSSNRSFTLNVYTPDPARIQPLIERSTGVFRTVRKLRPWDSNNFAIIMADSFVASFLENVAILTLSATAIAGITLFGAAIGLMNIMLVSVTERTMEIGLRKALGANRRQITLQFLTEAILICQLGGIVGILFGVSMGNLIGIVLGAGFVIPWAWIGISIIICFIVGVAAGLYPARKAAKLDPIDALRHE